MQTEVEEITGPPAEGTEIQTLTMMTVSREITFKRILPMFLQAVEAASAAYINDSSRANLVHNGATTGRANLATLGNSSKDQ